MASTPVTRASLVTRLQQRANTSGYVEPTVEAPQLIDTSCAKIYNMLVGIYEDYFTKAISFPILANQDTYTLPADFMKDRQLFYVDTSGRRSPLRRRELSDLMGTTAGTSYQQAVTGYATTNNQIILDPKPAGTDTGTILMWYVPEYVPPANDAAVVFPALAFGWDEWVVLDACIQLRLKSMMPAQELVAERAQLEAKFMHQAKNRNVGAPPRVRDTGWGGRGGVGTRGQFGIK